MQVCVLLHGKTDGTNLGLIVFVGVQHRRIGKLAKISGPGWHEALMAVGAQFCRSTLLWHSQAR